MHRDVLPNLLPEGAKRREQTRLIRKFAMFGTIAIAAILILVSLGMWRSAQNIDLRLTAEQRTLENVKIGMASLGVRTVETVDPGDIAFIRSEIQKKDLTFVTLLKYLSSRTPKDVYLKSIEFGGDFPPDPASPDAKKSPGTAIGTSGTCCPGRIAGPENTGQ